MRRGKLLQCLILLSLLSVVLFLAPEHAVAHIQCVCGNPPDQCTCFIQLGDTGPHVKRIIELLQKKGYLGKVKKRSEFTADVRQAVILFQSANGLECTGWMDDETLTMLLDGVLPDPSEKYTENRWMDICYVPTDGGKKYHTNPKCSDMLNPRMISRINARRLGLERCGRKNICKAASEHQARYLGLRPRLLPDEYYLTEESSDATTIALSGLLGDIATTRSGPPESPAVYIGNKKSHVFHLSTCGSATSMSEKNKVSFTSRDEAIRQGYSPCKKCQP